MDFVQAFQLVGITIAALAGVLTILKGTRELHRPRAEAFIGLLRDFEGSLQGSVQAVLYNGGNRIYLESLVFVMGLPAEERGVSAVLAKTWGFVRARFRRPPTLQFEGGFGVMRGEGLPKWLDHGESYRHFEPLDPIAEKADSVLAATAPATRAHQAMRHTRVAFVDGYGHFHEAPLGATARQNLDRWLDHRAGFEAATRSTPVQPA